MQFGDTNTRIAVEQANHLHKGIRGLIAKRARFLTNHPVIMVLTFVTAGVWLVFGAWFKLFQMSPRHRLIVAAVTGDAAAGPLTVLIGAGEILLALWILSGISPRVCAALQSIAIATMNALELSLARDLLLAPILMVCANTIFLVVVWYCALKVPPTQSMT
jgi:DoxX-like family